MEISGVGQRVRGGGGGGGGTRYPDFPYLVYLLLCVRVVSTHMPVSELLYFFFFFFSSSLSILYTRFQNIFQYLSKRERERVKEPGDVISKEVRT